MNYILATTLNPADAKGFEEFSFNNLTIMTFVLRPVTIHGQTTYVPVRIGV